MHGKNIIGGTLSAQGTTTCQSINPATGTTLPTRFFAATTEEVEQTMSLAANAFITYKQTSQDQRADFLEAIAEELLVLGDELVQQAAQESGLPQGRIEGERGRTVNQLRLFATLLREGSWCEAVIETAQPERTPVPKPDHRTMLRPLGPVVVFTASNFPLAFSTAGGDTASALAAGNPVVVKAHEAHLGTNELVSTAIINAAEKTNMPQGVFSSLNAQGYSVGEQLVKHPETKAVTFTGSTRGGQALMKIATERPVPIPVFAEMGSINPVLLLPEKLNLEVKEIAQTYAASITLGAGQFCTNPGLLIGLDSMELDLFTSELKEAIEDSTPQVMLTDGILKAYENGKETVLSSTGVSPIASSQQELPKGAGQPAIAMISGEDFINNTLAQEEVFGAFSLVIKCKNRLELKLVLHALKGQLTGTIMGTNEDVKIFENEIDILQEKVGRLIFNNVPTGVEVSHAMQHGGPFPAASDSRFTSVGTAAIKRFVRPICYQNCPESYLPEELKDANPLGIWRKVDGQMSKVSIVELVG
ncbi:aldehyde dehydrogenase (NADP(+)) [Algivirga pacifica]|uniref:Aldehyde dehydrogenase (NADP(+)) n=1 Tax=Algivirga pacifica TaxID=1162670 RepID=A0ABP9D8F7_9BACT